LFTDEIFKKQERKREEDAIGEENQEVILEVEGSQGHPSFLPMVEQQTSTAPHLNQMKMIVPWLQSSQDVDMSQNTSDV
jgi:hypothetical protein